MSQIPRRELVAWTTAGVLLVVAAVALRSRARSLDERAMAFGALSGAFSERDLCVRRLQRRIDGEDLERRAFELLGRPDTRAMVLAPQGGSPLRGSLIASPTEHEAFVLVSVMPPTDDEVLAVWIAQGDAPPRSAGVVRRIGDAVGIAAVALYDATPRPDRIVVALAPHGGSAAPAPDRVVLRGIFPEGVAHSP